MRINKNGSRNYLNEYFEVFINAYIVQLLQNNEQWKLFMNGGSNITYC